MKILISGGTGLVGTELSKLLVSKGHEVIILTRNPSRSALQCPFPHLAISWKDLETSSHLKNIDSIVNLAGAGINDQRWTESYKKKIYDSRISSTNKLVEVANKYCPQLQSFISASAVGIYGSTGSEIVYEDHAYSYGFLGQLCQDWETALTQLKDTRSVILRVGIVFSDKGGALSQMVPPIQMGVGGKIANGKQYMSWIDIDDLAAMFCFAIENPIKGVFNAVAPQPQTNAHITQAIAKHLGKAAVFPVPYMALRILLGPMAKHIVESQNISSQKIQQQGFKFKFHHSKDSIADKVAKLTGTQRRKIFQQWIPKKREAIFPFFADVKNLEEITPDNLQFQVLNSSTESIEKGTIINYKLKIDGLPVKWQTQITSWQPNDFFTDNQEKGPYKKWHHMHLFEDLAGGTLMTDQVDLEIPFGWLGHGLTSWKVFKDVDKIFKYRQETIFKLFGSSNTGF